MLLHQNVDLSEYFCLVHVNAQSLASSDHFNICSQLLANKIIDVLAVSETWFTGKEIVQSYYIPGYQCWRNNRLRKRGGGVCMYVRK
jgi:hypothetical protein